MIPKSCRLFGIMRPKDTGSEIAFRSERVLRDAERAPRRTLSAAREHLPRPSTTWPNTCQDVVGVNPGAAGSRSPAPPAMPAVPPPMVAPPPPDLLDDLI